MCGWVIDDETIFSSFYGMPEYRHGCSQRRVGQIWRGRSPIIAAYEVKKMSDILLFQNEDGSRSSVVERSRPKIALLTPPPLSCKIRGETSKMSQYLNFLPRCMECRRGLAMGILSVRLSICLSVRQTRGLWQNGRKLYLDFYIVRKNIYPSFLRRRMVGGGRPLLPVILGQPARVGAKSPILNQ